MVSPDAQNAGDTLPSSVTTAVLTKSNAMPESSQKVEELDFNKLTKTGQPITVDQLMGNISNIGFQGSAIGEAVRIINDMVRTYIGICLHAT
jgi:deoxyhypusine synthase